MSHVAFLLTAFVGVFVLNSLFSLFISTRRWRWPARFALLVVSVLPLLNVEAADLTISLLSAQLCIFGGVIISRRWAVTDTSKRSTEKGRSGFLLSFGLRDLMFGAVAASSLLALCSQTTGFGYYKFVLPMLVGIAAGTGTLASATLIRRRHSFLLSTGFGLISLIAMNSWVGLAEQSFPVEQKLGGWTLFPQGLLLLAAFIGGHYFLFAIYSYWSATPQTENKPITSLASFIGRLWIYGGSAILICLTATFAYSTTTCYVRLLNPPFKPNFSRQHNPSEPKGIDDFTKAGIEFGTSKVLSDYDSAPTGKRLRSEIDAYSESFDRIDLGISRKPQPLYDFDKALSWEDWMPLGTRSLRCVSRALQNRSRQENEDGNYDEAVNDGIRCLQMTRCLDDNFMIEQLVMIACESYGTATIQNCVPLASTAKLKEASLAIQQIINQSAPFAKIVANDRYFNWQVSNWQLRLLETEESQSNMIRAQLEAVKRRDIIRSQVHTAIALELYKRTHGKYPAELADLTPGELERLPLDPCSRSTPPRPFKYRIESGEPNTNFTASG